MNIKLKSLEIQNFKGIHYMSFDLNEKTNTISGRNASGKTTLLDAFKWCLFGNDSSGRTDFQIRPVDENGQMVHNAEISVRVTLGVDGETVTLEKRQKENWVKKRGSATPTLQGNTNSMEVNGFPTSQKDYDARIADILDESLFSLMTDPMRFASLPWKDQREILLRFVSEITDQDVLELDEVRFAPIAADILAAGAEASKDKATALLKRLKEDQKAYPVRIDEAMRNKTDALPEEQLIGRKAEIETELKAVQKELSDVSAASKSVSDVQDEIIKVKMEIGSIKEKVEAKNAQRRMDASQAVTNALMEVMQLEQKRDRLCDQKASLEKSIEDNEAEIKELGKQYKEVKSRAMPSDATICPTCGREFPADRIEEVKKEFESRKGRDLDRIGNRGQSYRNMVNAYVQKLNLVNDEIKSLTEKVIEADKKHKQAQKAAAGVQAIDYTSTKEYAQLEARMIDLNEKLSQMDDGDERRRAVKERENALQEALDDVNRSLSAVEANKRIDARIEELKAAQRECGQKVADAEQALYLIEEFMKLKMDTLSDRINSHFDKVRFKLFKTLINGAVQPTCVMQMASNGSYVDYPNLNHGAQIIAGLDVINALSTLYDVSAPIFIDNAECLSSDNQPETTSQLILLKVSDGDLEIVNE